MYNIIGDLAMQHVDHDGLNCKYCNKLCKNKNSLAQHECRCPKNPDRVATEKNLKNRNWAAGLTAETDERIRNFKQARNDYFSTHAGTFKGKHHSLESREKMSEAAKADDRYLRFNGSRKSFEYNGFKFMSTYEVAVAKTLDENHISWIKPKKLAYITKDNKKHSYIPDFYLPDYNVYLDPKNDYLIQNINPVLGYRDTDKISWVMQQNNVRVIILSKTELTWDIILSKILETCDNGSQAPC